MIGNKLGTWKNPPLAYVVAEIQISPHCSIENSIPTIQDRLRDEFPRTVELMEFLQQPSLMPTPQKVWQMVAADESRGVQISSRAISLHATAYRNSSDFHERWSRVLDNISQSKFHPFVERVGLRYVDLIVPTSNRSTQDYLASELRGIHTSPELVVNHRLWSLGTTDNGVTILINTASPSPRGGIWPSNLQIFQLLRKPNIFERAEKAQSDGKSTGFIDVDCSIPAKDRFDILKLKNLYKSLHAKMSVTFGILISESAKKEWM